MGWMDVFGGHDEFCDLMEHFVAMISSYPWGGVGTGWIVVCLVVSSVS